MFFSTILEKAKEARLKFCKLSVTVLWKMVNYEETSVK